VSTGAIVAVTVVGVAGCAWLWTSGVRAGRKVQRQFREVTRTGSVLLTGLLATVVIVAGQWAVITHTTDKTTILAVLGVPGLVAGMTTARLCAVTIGATGVRTRRGGR
jgi:hypothetical protein